MAERFEKKGEFAVRVIAGETILVPIRAGVGELGSIFTLNEVGARIWTLVGEGRTADEIAERVCEEFDVPREKAEQDVAGFLGKLLERGLIGPAEDAGGERGLR